MQNENKEKKSFKFIIITLLKIAFLFFFSYVIMVFISYFSVYHDSKTYTLKDSINAMLLKTDVPAEFFLYFGAFVIISVLIALFINLIFRKNKNINLH